MRYWLSYATATLVSCRLANSNSLPVRLKVFDPFSQDWSQLLAKKLMVEVAEDNKKKEKRRKGGCKKGDKVPMSGLNPRPPILHYHYVCVCT